MKLFVSADIEGVACIGDPAEVDKSQTNESAIFCKQMTAEVRAACEGAFAGGADTIVVKDAHWTGRNMDPHALRAPDGKTLRLIRGWSGHPFAMVQGIDASFDAVAFIGYHSAAGIGTNPLAHTISGRHFANVKINGETASEFLIYAYAAASVGVPLIFLSGDLALCNDAAHRIGGLETVPVIEGFGASVESILPHEATQRIRDGMERAISMKMVASLQPPRQIHTEIVFHKPSVAYAKAFYPGAELASDTTVVFDTNEYFEVLRFLWFMAQ